MSAYPLVMVEWVDTTNVAAWTELDDAAEWAKDGGFQCTNVGFLIYEDEGCVVLAARAAFGAEPSQIGLMERIPKGVITARFTLRAKASS